MAHSSSTHRLLGQARDGDGAVLARLFARFRPRLHRMVELRLDRRLRGRLDASDVLQEAYLEAAGCFGRYLQCPEAPFFLWLRCITGRKLVSLQRRHLGARARDVRREISIDQADFPEASSQALAAQLLGSVTSPSEAAARQERRQRLEDALDRMDPTDREVLVLRHFEQLSSAETARVLGIQKAAAIQRHVRALKRLRSIVKSLEQELRQDER